MRTSARSTIAYGHAGLGAQGSGFGAGPFPGGVDIGDIFGDLFGEMFSVGGNAQRGSRQNRGDDLRFDLAIDFEDAFFGIQTEVKIRRLETCDVCKAEAALPAADQQPALNARDGDRSATSRASSRWLEHAARVVAQGRSLAIPAQAAEARLAGHRSSNSMSKCRRASRRERAFATPAKATRDARAVPEGDLYVVLSIRPHDFFERSGYDLHCVIPISFPQAALGAEFEMPGIDGPVNLKIPEGTQSGRELRVRGRGVPYLNEKGHGDLIVKVLVQIPKKLSRPQRELVAKLAESLTVDNKPTSPGLLEKMKDLFN